MKLRLQRLNKTSIVEPQVVSAFLGEPSPADINIIKNYKLFDPAEAGSHLLVVPETVEELYNAAP